MIKVSHGSEDGFTGICEYTSMCEGDPFDRTGMQLIEGVNYIHRVLTAACKELGPAFNDVVSRGHLALYKDGPCLAIRFMSDVTPQESIEIRDQLARLSTETHNQQRVTAKQ